MGVGVELGYSALTRRDRLERIATAERDRRAGRIDMAVATLGEPTEWPARAVLALARLPEGEGAATRRVLESGLDVWAEELGLDPLSAEPTVAMGDDLSFDALEVPTLGDVQDELERPIEAFELDEAFAQAETQVEEMHDVNDVAQRVLLDEPLGLSEISEEGVEEIVWEPIEHAESLSMPAFFGPTLATDETADPFFADPFIPAPGAPDPVDAAFAPDHFDISPDELSASSAVGTPRASTVSSTLSSTGASTSSTTTTILPPAQAMKDRPSDARVLATLEGWLHNLNKDPRRNAR